MTFRNHFIHALLAGVFSTLISWFYVSVYAKNIVDFSEYTSLLKLLGFSLMITIGAAFLSAGISKVVKNKSWNAFLSQFILSGLTIALVFYVLKMDDPVLKNEDAALMIDYFKGFLMPLLFVPTLSWMSFRPLFFN
jgi:hypothetical protein